MIINTRHYEQHRATVSAARQSTQERLSSYQSSGSSSSNSASNSGSSNLVAGGDADSQLACCGQGYI